jgi:hypothetical protein
LFKIMSGEIKSFTSFVSHEYPLRNFPEVH